MNEELKYPSRETISKLTKELKLEGNNEFTQDWEYEVANANQLPEYISYYKTNQLNNNEKATLMRIILEAYDDYTILNYSDDRYSEDIEEIIEADYSVHEETIKYWACEIPDFEGGFAITSFIREIKDRLSVGKK